MASSNVSIGVDVSAYTPPLYSAVGPVKVDGLWHESNPTFHPWRQRKLPTVQRWKTAQPLHQGRIF
jgi:hypothetical protein